MNNTSDSNCKDGVSKYNDGVCELAGKLEKIKTANDNEGEDINVSIISSCANCGKEGANNVCNKCKQVKYCNAACKKRHRHKHKKDCEEHVRLAAERAARLHDEGLFKQPPTKEDCPICFLRIPNLNSGWKYQLCCGKQICMGCYYAPVYDNQGNKVDNKCPFCRIPMPKSDEEANERLKKRVEVNDPIAIYNLGVCHRDGIHRFPQDMDKALELFYRAGKLGYAEAYCNIGNAYYSGRGVERDEKKANHYYELSAMGGCEGARYNLGIMEENAGNTDRALKHYMIAVRDGDNDSLDRIKELCTNENVTKEDYMKALQSYQAYLGEIKSVQRDKAAAASERYKYY